MAKPIQHCKVINLQLNKLIFFKKDLWVLRSWDLLKISMYGSLWIKGNEFLQVGSGHEYFFLNLPHDSNGQPQLGALENVFGANII